MLAETASPYLMDEPPTVPGRVLLSRAFSHRCGLHYGHSEEDIDIALDPEGRCDDVDRRQILWAARLLGELLSAGEMRAFTRPVGGGDAEPLPTSAWDRDEFRSVLARSAIDPARTFDPGASPTYWIFLDAEDFDGRRANRPLVCVQLSSETDEYGARCRLTVPQ